MILEHDDYRAYLRSELSERKRRNGAYSMRAFARGLGITQSAVSQILARKKNLSPARALNLAGKLNLDPRETEYFCLLVQLEGARDPLLRERLLGQAHTLNPRRAPHELSVDLFRSIASWYHLVIRNLTEVDGFEFTPANIARTLGISPLEAEVAIDRLERLELIEKDPTTGRYSRTQGYSVIQSSVPNGALREFHTQMLEKARESLEQQRPQERVTGSETFAFSPEHMDAARQLTEDYFQKMKTLQSRPGRRTHVYHLGVQFFTTTPGERKPRHE